MSREIKFRAWLIKEMKMVEVKSFGYNKGYGGCTEIYVDVPDFDPYNEIILGIKPPHRKHNQRIGIEWYVNKPDLSPFIIMQYLERKDVIGVEIYEGDIIEWDYEYDSDYDGDMPIVKRSNGREVIKSIYDRTRINMASDEGSPVKVIGNIYEHSELINH